MFTDPVPRHPRPWSGLYSRHKSRSVLEIEMVTRYVNEQACGNTEAGTSSRFGGSGGSEGVVVGEHNRSQGRSSQEVTPMRDPLAISIERIV